MKEKNRTQVSEEKQAFVNIKTALCVHINRKWVQSNEASTILQIPHPGENKCIAHVEIYVGGLDKNNVISLSLR